MFLTCGSLRVGRGCRGGRSRFLKAMGWLMVRLLVSWFASSLRLSLAAEAILAAYIKKRISSHDLKKKNYYNTDLHLTNNFWLAYIVNQSSGTNYLASE